MRYVQICALVLLPMLSHADEVAEKGRAVFEAQHQAVVTVESVLSMSFGGESSEQKGWANGTMIDENGLTVLALSALDPTMMGEVMGEMPEGLTARISSLTIRMNNGDELPGELVLRDKDLDLAFVRPKTAPAEPLPHVDLENLGEPQLLDNVAVITQLGEVTRRAHTVLVTRIESVIEKPRPYYIIGADRANEVMCSPAFTLDGGFVGIGVMRAIRSDGGRSFGENVLVIIVPSSDIRDAAAQAPAPGEAAPEELAAPEEELSPGAADGDAEAGDDTESGDDADAEESAPDEDGAESGEAPPASTSDAEA